MNENENKDIKSLVLEKIQTGKISMTPHFYFVLKIAAVAVVAVLTLLVSSLLVSFIIFSLVTSGKLFLLGFGLRGFWMFFALFPWPLLILEIFFIFLLEQLIKKFKFGYRSSMSRLVLIILLLSIAISVIIDVTPFHAFLLHRAEQRNLPVFGDYYRGIRRPPPEQEIFRGVVTDVGTSSFVLKPNSDADDITSSTPTTYVIELPPGVPQSVIPTVGDTVFVAGQLTPDNTVRAYGFQKLPSPDVE